MPDLLRRFGLLLVLSSLLAGCASVQMPEQIRSLAFLDPYASAVHDYRNGRVMEARKKLLMVKKSSPDYRKAQEFLRQTVEPARKRLLNTYLERARSEEKAGRWAAAMRDYEQAAALSDKPAKLRKDADRMMLKLRQYRFERLLKQRREEDRVLLAALDALDGLRGLDTQDPVIMRERKRRLNELEDRARAAYRDAQDYLYKGLPEMAYVAIESYLRLVPDSDRGKRLKAKIFKQMPKGIAVPKNGHGSYAKKPLTVRRHVTRKEIEDLIRKGSYREARQAALVYRRAGGKDGDQLLERIERLMDKQAALDYARGRAAFRQEKLDEAIRYWRKAVALRPDRTEYVEALRRAELLKERLGMLR